MKHVAAGACGGAAADADALREPTPCPKKKGEPHGLQSALEALS